MDHNFIWTSKDVANVPNVLLCGMEIVDGYFKTFNQNPARDEYLMMEEKMNPEFDATTLTADWFTANVEVKDKNTFLWVTVINPALDIEPTDEDFSHSSNLQILADGTHKYLELKIHKDILDPALFEERFRR